MGEMIRFDIVESGNTIMACKMLGTIPATHEPENFNLYVRTVGSTVRIDRSDTDETIMSAVGFAKAMEVLAVYYGLPVVVTVDFGVTVTSKITSLCGTYGADLAAVTERRTTTLEDGTVVGPGDLLALKGVTGSPIWKITAVTHAGYVLHDLRELSARVVSQVRYMNQDVLAKFGVPVSPVSEFDDVQACLNLLKVNKRMFTQEVPNFGIEPRYWDKAVASGHVTLINDGPNSRYVATAYTADGVQITHGLPVWDYNLDSGFIDLCSMSYDGWFNVVDVDGFKISLMDASRVAVRHPFSGESAPAPDAPGSFSERDMLAEVIGFLDGYVDDCYVDGAMAELIKRFGVVPIASINPRDFREVMKMFMKPTEPRALTVTLVARVTTVTTPMVKAPIRTNLAKRSRRSARRARRGIKGGV